MKVWKATMSVSWEVAAMYKLLSADLTRLWKNRTFWIVCLMMLFLSAGIMLNFCRHASTLETASLDNAYFSLAPVLGIFCATFSVLFLGTEYSDGSIRNKLSVGHTRITVYLANLLVCFTATLSFSAVWLAGGLIGIPVLGTWKLAPSVLLLYFLLILLLAAVHSAIAVFISMLCSNKALAAAVSILFSFALLLCASLIGSRLLEPELISDMMWDVNGLQIGDQMPNPFYVGGALRSVLEFLLLFLPTGQEMKLAQLDASRPVLMLLCSAGITAVVTMIGILLFRKKDLK